jgi:alcohol dehydrogenase class IV
MIRAVREPTMPSLSSQLPAFGGFTYDALPGRVVFANGARSRLAQELERLGVSRALVIASQRDEALVAELCGGLGDRVAGRFDEVRPHVPVEVAQRARELAAAVDADCLLALGGGSTIGTAKAIALERPLPILVLPTTYAGSEMTPIWGLTEAGRKTTGRSPNVLPAVVIYDPELTLSLPPAIAGPSAVNAIAHCVEALYAPGANPVCSLLAQEGLGALVRAIPIVVSDPSDLAARGQALYGAYLAGACLAGAGTALHHRICHVLGGAYNLPHAETHTIVLPHVVAFIEPSAQAQLTRAAAAVGVAHTSELAGALFDLAARIGAPLALRDVGMNESELDRAVALVLESDPPAHPRAADGAALSGLLGDALFGRRPS